MSKALLILFAVFTAAAIHPCISAQDDIPAGVDIPAVHPTQSENPPAETPVVIGANDSVTVTTIEAEELNKVWHVSSTGDLDFPMVGRIHAEGLTTEGLEKELTEKLSRFIRNPQVTVYISEYRSQPVTITGAVKNPGILQIQGPKTL